MADKKDLSEAQSYSRRRLVTAFTSGIPSGVELTPKKNQTPVIVGLGLVAIAILISVFYGIMSPSLPSDWKNNKLIVAKDSAARYVSVNGTLHPVINAISARLLIPSSDFEVLTVDDDQLAGIPIGSTLGILGAPDSLPAQNQLAAGALTSCMNDKTINNIISANPVPAPSNDRSAIVATVDGTNYLITGSKRYELPSDASIRDSFLRAFGVPQTKSIPASIQWINLFEAGSPIKPVTVPGAGTTIDIHGTRVQVGSIVTQQGAAKATKYVVQEDGKVTALDDFSYSLYIIDKPEADTRPTTLSSSDFQSLANASSSPIPSNWPTGQLQQVTGNRTMCATFPMAQSNHERLSSRVRLISRSSTDTPSGTSSQNQSNTTGATVSTTITGGTGALLRASIGDTDKGTVFAIDSTGTAYPIPHATEEILKRLGYTGKDVQSVPRSWADIFPSGVQLTTDDAGSAPNPQAVIEQNEKNQS
ncbi:type VII secretion protein EccB [Bifidobacterium sp. LC6]|uniref:Type VII secretion protein EccB n=1 Tax=Bifidobacterium colobi TaxID=2809026 RepID=A0ABS5UV29_9BIFI|nr:type VII secretion protein EccB [Bifidobacterium colobi]MBT1174541.1 type VII secretion protein EccB [Bifidobacterium colobi]